MMGKKYTLQMSAMLSMLNLSIFLKKIEQKSLESEITLLQEEIKQDPLNFERMKKLKSLQNQLKKMIASRRFKLTRSITVHFTKVISILPTKDQREKMNPEEMKRNKS